MSSVSNVKKKGKDTLPVVVAAVKTVKDATSGVVVLAPATAIAVAIVQKLAKAVDNADRCNLMIECIVNLLNAVAKGCEGASGKPEVTDRVKTLEHDLEEICKSVEAVMKAQNRWRYVVPEKYGSQLDALDSKMKHCLDKYQITAIAYNVEHQNRELRLVSEAMERLNGKLGQSSISGVDPNGLTADEELTTGTCECPPTILAVTRWLQKQAPWSSIGDIAPNIAQDVINMLQSYLDLNPAYETQYRGKLMKSLYALAMHYNALPRQLDVRTSDINSVDDAPRCGGGYFADIHGGKYQGRSVCLKVLRIHSHGPLRMDLVKKAFCEEALTW